MTKITYSIHPIMLLSLLLLITPDNTSAFELLYSEEFQAETISEDWLFYGDPVSVISLDKGSPAPSFNNNGDSMGSSGIKSRRMFSFKNGIVIQADFFVSCHPRGTWVGIEIGLYANTSNDNLIQLDTKPNDIVLFNIDYSGELDWACPHLETVIHCTPKFGNNEKYTIIHANKYLNSWQTLRIELLENNCNFFLNDTLHHSFTVTVPDSITEVGIFIGGRATSWGTALVDNLIVYRP